MRIQVTAAVGSGNETTFNLIDSNGDPVDLTALDVTVVTVEVCGGPLQGSVKIDSNSDDVSFTGSELKIKFGALDLNTKQTRYFPKISYVTSADPLPEVIVGEGYATEILLKVIC